VIISDTYTVENGGNQNIKIYKNIAGAESEPFIANCDFVVIPIDDGKICSGDTVLLTAMSLKKIVVVTKPSTLSEMYIQDGVDGLTVEKNVSNFTKLINKIITTDDYKQIGESARSSFLTLFSRESMGKSVAKAIKRSNE
jgi:glycosyltransferase involved in cell wall biosynthesis